MSNRDGGHYDSDGNYWPPYSEPSFWRKVYVNVVAGAMFVALLAGVGAISWWSITRHDPDREMYPQYDENDRFRVR